MEDLKYMVCVECLTYNHSSWIENALSGFCQQDTCFPFICVILDDNSNDGEQDVIIGFLEENFNMQDNPIEEKIETQDYKFIFARHKSNRNCYFAVYFLKYNYYQKKKSKSPFFLTWSRHSKYVAMCEGDDYWIDPLKLNKQVAFLDSNPSVTMVCNRAKLYSESKQAYVGEVYCYEDSREVDAVDVIRRTGLFIPSCSIIYRKLVSEDMPKYWQQCQVGDYPLQIMSAMKGRVFYFNEIMSVYRIDNSKSWSGRQQFRSASSSRMSLIKSEVLMFAGFGEDFPKYKKVLQNKIAHQINANVPGYFSKESEKRMYLTFFSEEIKKYSVKWRIDLWIRLIVPPRLLYYYNLLFLNKYRVRTMMYSR